MRPFQALIALGLLLAGAAGAGGAMAANGAPPAGDQVLARAAIAKGVQSYTVPVHFEVHLHKPIGAHTEVDGIAYYQAPGHGALVLDKAHGIIGSFFKGTYDLDLVPQTWPANYRVLSMSTTTENGQPVIVLDALPRTGGEDIASVVFRLGGPRHAPIGANWTYKDRSTIALTLANGPVGTHALPQTATVAVDMPKYKLDGTVTYGTYALNAPVDPAVFAKK
jgi:hypothetical protein